MRAALFIFFFGSVLSLQAQTARPDTLKYCLLNNNLGIGGYDPVSYFLTGKPQKGSRSISATYDGVQYNFLSDQNKKVFVQNPKKFLPQFGGWCSMTLAMGKATQPTFDNFLIDSGKLYLFERTLSLNGREIWLKDVKTNQRLASANYETLVTRRGVK